METYLKALNLRETVEEDYGIHKLNKNPTKVKKKCMMYLPESNSGSPDWVEV